MKLCTAFLLALMFSDMSSDRVIDRFPGRRLPTGRCRIAIPIMSSSFSNSGTDSSFNQQQQKYQKMNCSFIEADFSSVGVYSNGSYDGLVGMIQRDEMDTIAFMYRSDFFDVVPGFMLSAGMPADVVIVMKKNASTVETLGLISLWSSSFDTITISYVLISIFMLITVLSFASGPTFSVATLLRNMSSNLRRSLFAIFDQENFEAENESSRVAVLFFNLFLLFGIHGLMLGCLGADLVSVVDHPIYESLDEFSNTSHVQPTVMSNLWLMPVLEKTRPESDLWPLKLAVDADPDHNVMKVSLQNKEKSMATLMKLTGDIASGKRALIVPKYVMISSHEILCTLLPERAKDFVSSKSSFGHGLLVSLMSYKINPALRTFMEYQQMTNIETGQGRGLIRMIYKTRVLPTMTSGDEGWSKDKNKCFEGFKQETRGPVVFGMGLFAPMFKQLVTVT